jgi:hypothetical protein
MPIARQTLNKRIADLEAELYAAKERERSWASHDPDLAPDELRRLRGRVAAAEAQREEDRIEMRRVRSLTEVQQTEIGKLKVSRFFFFFFLLEFVTFDGANGGPSIINLLLLLLLLIVRKIRACPCNREPTTP